MLDKKYKVCTLNKSNCLISQDERELIFINDITRPRVRDGRTYSDVLSFQFGNTPFVFSSSSRNIIMTLSIKAIM